MSVDFLELCCFLFCVICVTA